MYIRKYEALDMQEALRLIKEDLGPQAVILSSRKIRKGKGTFGLLGRSVIEVTAAADRDEWIGAIPPVQKNENRWLPLEGLPFDVATSGPATRVADRSVEKTPPSAAGAASRSVEETPPAATRAANRTAEKEHEEMVSFSRHLRDQEAIWNPLQSDIQQIKELLQTIAPPPSSAANVPVPISSQEIKQELSELKEMVCFLLGEMSRLSGRDLPPELLFLHQRLISQGVKPDLVLALLERVRDQVHRQGASSTLKATTALKQAIMDTVLTAGPFRTEQGGQKVVAFIGPTGVGKTTTVAKLAAHYALLKKKTVALVSLDTYRVAAAEQLKTYARLIGVSTQVALSGRELRGILSGCRDKDLVLIDTAGRSQNAVEQMAELKTFFSADLPVDFYLVVSATTKERDLWEVHQRFMAVSPLSGIIFTKLDESQTFGGILNQVVSSRLPLSYLTTGQRVPEDIEVATKERVAELILKGAGALTGSLPRELTVVS